MANKSTEVLAEVDKIQDNELKSHLQEIVDSMQTYLASVTASTVVTTGDVAAEVSDYVDAALAVGPTSAVEQHLRTADTLAV